MDERLLRGVLPWRREEDELVAETRIFSLRRHRSTSPTRADHAGEFVYLDSADWVNVVALTAEREVVLIEQYRHGTAEVTLEIPGGMVDPGEDPLTAGLRELREETGFEGRDGRLIGSVTPNPAILNNRCHTFLARDARLVATPQMDGSEDIQSILVDAAEIPSLITSGQINHALVIAAFYFYDQYRT